VRPVATGEYRALPRRRRLAAGQVRWRAFWDLARTCGRDVGLASRSYQTVDNDGVVVAEFHPGLNGNVFALLVAGEGVPLQVSLVSSRQFFAVGGFDPRTDVLGVEDRNLAGASPWSERLPHAIARRQDSDRRVGSTTNWQSWPRATAGAGRRRWRPRGIRPPPGVRPLQPAARPGDPRLLRLRRVEPQAKGPPDRAQSRWLRCALRRPPRGVRRDSGGLRTASSEDRDRREFLTHPQPGGFKTYTVNLLTALSQVDPSITTCSMSIVLLRRSPSGRPQLHVSSGAGRAGPSSGCRSGMQVLLRRRLAHDRPDVVHFLCNTAPASVPPKSLLTSRRHPVHEPAPVVGTPVEGGRKGLAMTAYSAWAIRHAARQSRRIITPSRYEKNQITSSLGIRPNA